MSLVTTTEKTGIYPNEFDRLHLYSIIRILYDIKLINVNKS